MVVPSVNVLWPGCLWLLISNRGAKQTIRNCNKVRSAILTSFLILLMMRLSCSEKFSALSNAFAKIPSAILSWSTNHLMSFDTFFIILFFWFYVAKIQKNPNNRIPFHLSYIFRALINILPLPVTFPRFSCMFRNIVVLLKENIEKKNLCPKRQNLKSFLKWGKDISKMI